MGQLYEWEGVSESGHFIGRPRATQIYNCNKNTLFYLHALHMATRYRKCTLKPNRYELKIPIRNK